MIHTIISEERRKAPRELALSHADQLHTTGTALNHPEDDNITYAAEWDGVSPWIVVHKGSIADLKMAYAGWPMVTREEWEAAHPPRQP